MDGRQRLAVHLGGEEDLRLHRLVERNRAAEVKPVAVALGVVEATEGGVPGVGGGARRCQDVGQADPGPARVRDRFALPGELVRNRLRRRELAPPVAGALEGCGDLVARKAGEIGERKGERLAHGALHFQPERRRVDRRDLAVVAHEEEVVRRHEGPAQLVRGRPAVERALLADQQAGALAVQ